MKKLPDELACRNIIRASRKRQRTAIKTKSITLKADEDIESGKIYATLTVNIHKNSGVVSLSHGLRIKQYSIHYGKNQKRSCKTERGMEQLARQRERSRISTNKYKIKYLYAGIGKFEGAHIADIARVNYNPRSDDIRIYSLLDLCSKGKTKRIYWLS